MNSITIDKISSSKVAFDKLAPAAFVKSASEIKEPARAAPPKQKERPWKLRHVRTFTRDFKELKHTPRFCYVCRAQCRDDEHFAKHLEAHGSEFRFLRQVEDYIMEEPMFQIRLDYRPDFAKTLVYVKNVSPHPVVLLNMAYLHLADGQLMTLFESEKRIPWGSFSTFSFNSCLLSELNRNFALILVGLATAKTEILEQYNVQVTELSHFLSEQLVLKKPPIHCPALNHYPVPAVIQELYKNDFSPKLKFAGAKALLDKLTEFKQAKAAANVPDGVLRTDAAGESRPREAAVS